MATTATAHVPCPASHRLIAHSVALFSAAATVAVIAAGFDYTGIFIFFVVPIGALLTAAVATSGFALAVRGLRLDPRGASYAAAAALGVAVYLAAQYLGYRQWLLASPDLAEPVSFFAYYNNALQSQELSLIRRTGAVRSVGSVGAFGYLLEAVAYLGAVVGAAIPVFLAGEADYCVTCRKTRTSRTLVEDEGDGSQYQQYIETHALRLPQPERLRQRKPTGIKLELSACPGCEDGEFRLFLADDEGHWVLENDYPAGQVRPVTGVVEPTIPP